MTLFGGCLAVLMLKMDVTTPLFHQVAMTFAISCECRDATFPKIHRIPGLKFSLVGAPIEGKPIIVVNNDKKMVVQKVLGI